MNLKNEKSFYCRMRNIVKNKVNTINALASDIYYGIYFYQYDSSLGDPKFYDYDYNMKPLQQSTEQLGQDMLFPKIAEILGLKYLDDDFPERFYCKINFMINTLDKKLQKEDSELSFYQKSLTNLLQLVLPQEADIFKELRTIDGKLKYFQKYLIKYDIQPPNPKQLEDFGNIFPDRVLKRFLIIQGLEKRYDPVKSLISMTITQQKLKLHEMLFPQMTTGMDTIYIQPRPKSPPKMKEIVSCDLTDSQTKRVNDTVQKNKDKLKDFIPKLETHHNVVAPRRLIGLQPVEEYQFDRLSGTVKLKTVYLPAHEAKLRTLRGVKIGGPESSNGLQSQKQQNNKQDVKISHVCFDFVPNHDGFIVLQKSCRTE